MFDKIERLLFYTLKFHFKNSKLISNKRCLEFYNNLIEFYSQNVYLIYLIINISELYYIFD